MISFIDIYQNLYHAISKIIKYIISFKYSIFIDVRNDIIFNLKPYREEKILFHDEKKEKKKQTIFSDIRIVDRAVTAFSLEDELIDRAVSYRTRQIAWKFYRGLHNARDAACVLNATSMRKPVTNRF